MTHQSVKQNDVTQWVQRFYEVEFECFFKYKRSARFQICTSFIVAVLGFNPGHGNIKFTVAALSEHVCGTAWTESADDVCTTSHCCFMLQEASFGNQ